VSAARRQLPPPAGADQLTALLRRRHTQEPTAEPIDDVPAAAPASPAATAPPAAAPVRPSPVAPATDGGMVRRSWYVPRSAADALVAAVDDLHHETRRPKHEVLAVLLALAVEDLDRARNRLTEH